MFQKAGYNPRFRRTGIRARVWRPGWQGARSAELVVFRSGDTAWRGDRGISWGEELRFLDFLVLHAWEFPDGLASSSLESRHDVAKAFTTS